MTINAIIADVKSGAMTVEHAAQTVDSYALAYYSPAEGEWDTLTAIRAAYDAMRPKTTSPKLAPVAETLVACRCGHTVSKLLVMSTSTGTSCPDCYDRMSQ